MKGKPFTLAPLFNLKVKSEGTTLRVNGDRDVEIRALDLDTTEVPHEVQQEIGFDKWSDLWDHEWAWMFVRRAHNGADGTLTHSTDEVDQVLSAVRLAKDAPVWAPVIWTGIFGEEIDGVSGISYYPDRWTVARAWQGAVCELGSRDIEKIQAVLEALTGRVQGPVGFAIERYNVAMERASSHDTLEDLFKVLEAILPADNARGAIKETLAMRVGFLLGGTQQERDRIRSEVDSYYRIRNDITHPKGFPPSVGDFASLSKIVRRVLKIAVTEPEKTSLVSGHRP